MCGIVGYAGKLGAVNAVIDGLRALEYRGYDSAGITFINAGGMKTKKQVGRVQALEDQLQETLANDSSGLAIGHTRWATHGAPTTNNAHPHYNESKNISVVHNGIIENYLDLKNKLIKNGYRFLSDTDTEVIPHLIDYYSKQSEIGRAHV